MARFPCFSPKKDIHISKTTIETSIKSLHLPNSIINKKKEIKEVNLPFLPFVFPNHHLDSLLF